MEHYISVILKEPVLKIPVPEYLYKAYTVDGFRKGLEAYLYNVLTSPGIFTVNDNDINEAVLDYRRRKKGLDALSAKDEVDAVYVQLANIGEGH